MYSAKRNKERKVQSETFFLWSWWDTYLARAKRSITRGEKKLWKMPGFEEVIDDVWYVRNWHDSDSENILWLHSLFRIRPMQREISFFNVQCWQLWSAALYTQFQGDWSLKATLKLGSNDAAACISDTHVPFHWIHVMPRCTISTYVFLRNSCPIAEIKL